MDAPQPRWKLRFFTIWSAQQASILGSMLASFAIIWWVTQETGSAVTLTTLTIAQMLPAVILGPFIGALVDRWNRRKVMIVADSVVALSLLALAYLFWKGRLQMAHIYVIMVIRSIAGTFHWPAMSASTPLMVPKEQLTRIAGMNQTVRGIWAIIAPPLGALLMEALPLYAILAIDVVTAAIAVTPLFFIDIPQPAREEGAAPVAVTPLRVWRDVKEGIGYVVTWPGMLMVLLMAAMVNALLGPAFSLLPLLVKDHFGGGAMELGWANSAYGVGVVAGGLVLSVWGGFKRRISTTALGLAGMGLGCLIAGFSPAAALATAIAGLAVLGFFNPIANGPVNAILQSITAPEKQGRIFTLVSTLADGMAPLGMAIAGPIADRYGVQLWFIIGGVACALTGLAMRTVPAIYTIEQGPPQRAAAPGPVDNASDGMG